MELQSSMYEQNLSILMERFPRLGLLAPTLPLDEMRCEPLLSNQYGKAEAIYVYGLGGGVPYIQLSSWLRENQNRILIFLEDEPGQLASLLYCPEAREMLADPQVEIELFSRKSEEIQALADRFPYQKIELLTVASKSKDRARKLRLQLLRKTTLSHALYLDRIHGYQPFQNFVKNLSILPQSFYANRMKDAFRGIPAVVCGAGPSLNQAIAYLKLINDKALLIAGGSTLAALSSKGVLPHFGMAIDPNLEEYRRLKNSFAFEVPLLYSTRVFPSIFQTCNGPFGYLRSGIGGIPEIWMEEELELLDPLLGEHLSPESISVTAICLAWAQFLGCDPIFLSGVDLAYTGKKRYADGVDSGEEIPFASIESETTAADRILKKKNRRGEAIYTSVRWVMEAASLSHYAKKHPEVRFYNTSDEGLSLSSIPHLPFPDAIERFCAKTYDLRTLVHNQIMLSPMPANTKNVIDREINQLKQSLTRVIACLEILAKKMPGSTALAEIELHEESAFSFFFYDIHSLLSLPHRSFPASEERKEKKWDRFLDLAKKYSHVFP